MRIRKLSHVISCPVTLLLLTCSSYFHGVYNMVVRGNWALVSQRSVELSYPQRAHSLMEEVGPEDNIFNL